MKILIAVAAGGAIGAVGRYLMMFYLDQFTGHNFPWSTVVVNLLGSFALGVILEISPPHWFPTIEFRAFFALGVMGAFTTFSTFSMDTYYLVERGKLAMSVLYVGSSVMLCTLGFWAGVFFLRRVLQLLSIH